MRFLPTRIHGMMDYVAGVLFVVSPWLFGFSEHAAATWSLVGVGLLVLMLSSMTDYETALVRKIPMSTHLAMDAIAGLFLVASPWLLGFAGFVWVPHVLFGLAEIGAALVTRTVPSDLPLAGRAGARVMR